MCGTCSYSICQEKQTGCVTCVLFEVSSKSKGYRVFDPTTNKIIVSRSFRENREWDWKFF